MAVITISRQYGSGGKEIAAHLCEALGYDYFDKTMMAQVAQEMGLSEDEVVDFSEDTVKMGGLLNRILGLSQTVEVERLITTTNGLESSQVEELNEEWCVDLTRKIITEACRRGNIVIVGRGGQAILREEPGVLHVRIEAPLGARALRIKEREKSAMEDAAALAERKEQSAARFLSRFFDIDWQNATHYHMVLNTGRWNLDQAAEIIINALGHLHIPRH